MGDSAVRFLALVLLIWYAAGGVRGSAPLVDATQYSVADKVPGLWGVPVGGRESRLSVEFMTGGHCLMMHDGKVITVATWRVIGNRMMIDVPGAERFTYAVVPAPPDRLFLVHVATGTKFVLMKK
jgi:hypothetical protein